MLAEALALSMALSEALTVAEPLALLEALTEAESVALTEALRLASSDNIWLSRMLAESMAETCADSEALRLG